MQLSSSCIPRTFHLASRKFYNHSTLTPLSVSVDLTTLGPLCKWNHTIFVLLCLAYFTQHNALKVHPCCSMCQDSFLFEAEQYSIVWIEDIFFIHSSISGHLRCFYLLAAVKDVGVNVDVQISLLNPAFSSFGYTTRSEIAGSYGNSIF